MSTVFVSYSSRDGKRQEFIALLSDLERLKHPVWYDHLLTGGQQWWDEILHQIRECSLFLMVASHEWLASQACRAEREYAAAMRRPMLCVDIDDVESALPASLSIMQVVSYSQRSATAESGTDCLFALHEAMSAMAKVAVPSLPEPLAAAPPVPYAFKFELKQLLEEPELQFSQQRDFLNRVRAQADDQAKSFLLPLLQAFLRRPELTVKAKSDAEDLVERLTRTADGPAPTPDPQAQPDPPDTADDQQDSRSRTMLTPGAKDNFKVRHFHAPGVDVARLSRHLTAWFENQKLEVQSWEGDGEHIVQARSQTWQRAIGAGAALTVVMSTDDATLDVEIGGAKWLDKLAAGGVGMFVLWPAVFTAAFGGWRQYRLPQATFDYIERTLPQCIAAA
jgi:hypothetical protein